MWGEESRGAPAVRVVLVVAIGAYVASGAACGGDDESPIAIPEDSGLSDARADRVAPDARDASLVSDASMDGARSEAATGGGDADGSVVGDASVDAIGPSDAATAPDARDAAPIDVFDANTGAAPGCFHFSQGASPSGYTASVPRIAPGGALAQVWAANAGATSASLFARFGGLDGGFSGVPLAPISGAWRAADVARNGSTFASVYATAVGDAGSSSIFFLTFDSAVTADAGVPILVSAGVDPLLARGASEYGVAWFTNTTYAFARLSNSGVLLDAPQPLGGQPVLVARTGTEYGVIYLPGAPFGSPADLKLARFSASTGQRVGTDVTMVTYLSNTGPATGGTGDGYVVAWWEPSDGGLPSQMLARFDAAGASLWKKPAGSGQSVAWSGAEIALLYFTTSGSGLDIRANAKLERYTATGDPIPGIQTDSLGISNPQGSQLAWTGSRYSYSLLSHVQGLDRSVEVGIDCFVGNGLPIQ